MAKKVTVINADRNRADLQERPKLKVCGYARVSTGSRAQAESYAAQIAYFTEKIENNPLWEFAGMYADEAATGTKVKGREEFQAMVSACEDGDIDLILTKSVTRFARNTVECIQTIRKLKALGIGILFEKENINTLTEKSEVLLTILSSIAHGESEDFSGNNRWAVEKRFRDGTYIIGTPAYGYRNDGDGNLAVEDSEAEIVREILEYRNRTLHMDGEKYKNRYVFSGRIICGGCGSSFRRQKIYIGQPYEKIIWTCHKHVEDKNACPVKAIREDMPQQAFVTMWNKLYTNQGSVLEPLLKELTEFSADMPDTEEIIQLDNEIQNLSEQSRILNQVMKKGYMDSALFMESNSQLIQRLTECRRKRALLARKQKRTKETVRTQQLIALIAEQKKPLTEYDENLFDLTVKEIQISEEHDIIFCLHNGLKLTEKEGGDRDAVAYADRI